MQTQHPSPEALENVLLILYHRNCFYREGPWDLVSALKHLDQDHSEEASRVMAEEFLKRGWAIFGQHRRDEEVMRPSSLTDEGRRAAVRLLQERHFNSPLERLHRFNWTTWGGVAALIAAIASVAALFK